MPLDPHVARFLQTVAETSSEPASSLAEQRHHSEQTALAQAGEPEDVASIEDRLIRSPAGTLPVRIYTPAGAEQGPFPALVYFHSGGWVFRSIEAHDPVCRALANHAHCLVVSVGYRLAPEHTFPAARKIAMPPQSGSQSTHMRSMLILLVSPWEAIAPEEISRPWWR